MIPLERFRKIGWDQDLDSQTDPKGYYAVVGLASDASADEIRKAFRATAMEDAVEV